MAKFDIASYFSKDTLNRLHNKIIKYYRRNDMRTVFAAIGITVAAYKSASFFAALYRNFLRPGHNLIERYGRDSWVVITGASDGIGKAFAIEFAALGFNIVLIARNKEKLNVVVDEIKKVRPETKTQVVIADFTQSYEENFYENIYDQIKDLDISILINNVGLSQYDVLFNTVVPSYLFDLVTVNTAPQTMMSKILIDKFLKRPQKTAILNLSSLVSDYAFVYDPIYSATKRYNDVQTKVFQAEFGDKIDVLCVKPGYVSTQMNRHRNIDFITTDTHSYVRSVMRQIGHAKETYGHWKHDFKFFLLGYIPRFLVVRKPKPYADSQKVAENNQTAQ